MSDFVEQCRREWKRLGVPDPFAEEMASDLAADLQEAETEGVSAEEFLGNSVFDPASFAASWAAERGVVPAPQSGRKAGRRPGMLVAFTAVAAVAVLVAALLLLTGQPNVSLVASRTSGAHLLAPPAASVGPSRTVRQVVLSKNTAAPIEWILLFVALVALGFAAWLWSNWGRSQRPAATA